MDHAAQFSETLGALTTTFEDTILQNENVVASHQIFISVIKIAKELPPLISLCAKVNHGPHKTRPIHVVTP